MSLPPPIAVAVTFEPPLVVDVDGTLVVTDLIQEAALQLVARHPLQAFCILSWLRGGKSNLKMRLADRVDPGIDTVPLRAEVLSLIRGAQAAGRPVYLASASDRRYVERLAERISGIAGVFGTEDGINLIGSAKADRLVAAFGAKGYDYIGDTSVDFAVWRAARKPLVVAHGARFADRVADALPGAEIVARSRLTLRSYVRALRPNQWAKNALLFLPMIAGHHLEPPTIVATLLAFFCFCCAASGTYVINDLLDLPGDREHPRKRHRPFAAGEIPITHGLLLAFGTTVAAFAASLLLPRQFSGVLALYVICTLAYSLLLKRRVIIDVIMLGGLYTLRVLGGLAAVNLPQTQWLLMFSLFLFLSLAIVKRCSELVGQQIAGRTSVAGRGYQVEDLRVLFPLGGAAGYGSVFVVTLYLSSPEVMALYTHPHRLWLVCPLLLYWISRMLITANRNNLRDDPLIYALTDRISWIVGICVATVIAVAL
jgi:4-hydroxybenzoate polyprenyltransferase/phosphoserine phosphatase